MIIIKHVGSGLGNQLNLLALYTFLGRKHKTVKMQDHDKYTTYSDGLYALGLRNLNVNYKKSTALDELVMKCTFAPTIQEWDVDEILHIQGNAYVNGYFSPSWPGYDERVIDDVRKLVRYYPSASERNNEISRKIKEEMSISVHFRRTDYLDDANQNLNIAGERYYKAAINYVLQKYGNKNPVLYFFSDDRKYIHEYIKENRYDGSIKYEIVDWNEGKNGIYDFMFMSQCKVNICANSSFSGWAALLNDNEDKECIKPQRDSEYRVSLLSKDFTYINVATGEILDRDKYVIGYDYSELKEKEYAYKTYFDGIGKCRHGVLQRIRTLSGKWGGGDGFRYWDVSGQRLGICY